MRRLSQCDLSNGTHRGSHVCVNLPEKPEGFSKRYCCSLLHESSVPVLLPLSADGSHPFLLSQTAGDTGKKNRLVRTESRQRTLRAHCMDGCAPHTTATFEWKRPQVVIETAIDITVSPKLTVSTARASSRFLPGIFFEFFLKTGQIYPNINYDRCGDSRTGRYNGLSPFLSIIYSETLSYSVI